jgi:DNA polymerase III sliding clamp (beta) subunit (PCNA family)
MKVNKEKLRQALEIVRPGLANKEVIEQATSFAFMDGRVVTYNDEISISHPVEGIEIEGAVKADQLYQLLGKIKQEEIELEIEEASIIVKSGRVKAGLAIQPEITLPLSALSGAKEWHILPENFVSGLSMVVGSAGKDMSRPKLTCIHVNKGGWIEASDGMRVAKCLVENIPINTFLIPATSIVIVIKQSPVEIARSQGWVHFKTEQGTMLSCRIYEDDAFPDTANLFDVEGIQITLPKSIEEALDRASVFAKREHILDESIDVLLSTGMLKIKGTSDTGWIEEDLRIRYNGPEVEFSVSPYLLRGILSKTLTCILGYDKMKFEGDGWMYINALRASR